MKTRRRIAITAAVLGVTLGSAGAVSAQAVLTQGFLNADHYYEAGAGVLVSDLFGVAKFPDSPDFSFIISKAGLDQTAPDLSNFGARVTGWVQPNVTGSYRFFLRSDDGAELYINGTAGGEPPDPFVDNPAAVVGLPCCAAFQEPGTTELRTSEPYSLTAGQRYGITILLKEAGGGDYVYVAWRLEGDTTPAAELQTIPGPNLFGMVDPAGRQFNILQHPQSQTVTEERFAVLSIEAESLPNAGEYSVQWLKDGQPIPGAAGNSYRTPVLSVADSGAVYIARIYATTGQVDSNPATITVVPDTFPPAPMAGAILSSDGTTVDVGVGFDERINDTAAGVAGNYSISQGTISSFAYYPKSQSALLKVTGLTPGASATVTVQNIADVKGNTMTTPVNVPVTVSSTLKWGVVGGAELGLDGNYVVPISDKDFDIYSNGMTEWGTYDEATFVYEEITGDFDKKAQVIYQDLSSQWARAGLIARDVTNFGVGRDAQQGVAGPPVVDGVAGRYQKVHVNPSGPTLTGPGTAGNNAWEGNRRLSTGPWLDAANATSSAGGGGGPLDYPNTWVRLQRADQTFTIYRSTDGLEWVSMGSTTWGVTTNASGQETFPMPETMYVGPEYSPENGNITVVGDRGTWLAQIRNYGDTFEVPVEGDLTDGLVAYWNFDGNFFDSIKDFHGTGRGTNQIVFVDGKAGFGQAIKLDGNDQFVEITGGNEDELEFPAGSMSIAGWFKVDAFDTEWQALISKGEGSNYRVARRAATGTIAYAGGTGEGADDVPAVNDGQWQHFVAVTDATGAEFGTALYLNGVLHGVNTNAAVLTNSTFNLMIGENPGARGREWEGEIDDIGIWNRVLTAAEVATLYNGGSGTALSSLPGIVAPIVTTITESDGNVVIGWSPAGGTLESSPTLGSGASWSEVGTANPATIPVGTGNAYYRVQQ